MRLRSLGVLALLATPAVADPTTAETAKAAAKAAAKAGDFATAAAKFREAFAADPRPEHICNVGIAFYKGADLPRAERYIDQCEAIGKGLEKSFLADVAKVHAALNSKLEAGKFTPVDIVVEPQNASTTVTGGVPFDEPFVGSGRLWFPFGSYTLVVHAVGYVDQVIELKLDAHAPSPQRVTLVQGIVALGLDHPLDAGSNHAGSDATGSAAGSATVELGSGGSAGSAAIVPPPPRGVLRHRYSYTMPSVATAITAGVGIASLITWIAARGVASNAGGETDPNKYFDDVGTARSLKHWSWVGGGVAGVGAIVTALLWYRATTTTYLDVSASGSGAGIALTGAW